MNTRQPKTKTRAVPALLLGISALLASGCNGDDMSADVNTSTLQLGITDAPLDSATRVWVQFTGVEVKPSGGPVQSFAFNPAKGFDLLTLQNGNAAVLLGDSTVAAGEYEWIRLLVDPAPGSSYIVDATGQHDLRIPSGLETGLKLVRGFTMPAGGRGDFTIDFVLGKSIIAPPGQSPNYMMKPVLRLTDNTQVGTLAGVFNPQTLAAQPACANRAPTIYLYTGVVTTPDDLYNPVNDSADTMPTVDPLVTATAALVSGQYAYRIGFVPVGSYTVAFTCNNDDPLVDENTLVPNPITFTLYPQAVSIAAGMTTTANF